MDSRSLLAEIGRLAELAVAFDRSGNVGKAIWHYSEAANLIDKSVESGQIPAKYTQNANKYKERGQTLALAQQNDAVQQNAVQQMVERALALDEQGRQREALQLYTRAAEICIFESSQEALSASRTLQLKTLAKWAIERAEAIANCGIGTNLLKRSPTAPELTDEDDEQLENAANPIVVFPQIPTDELSLVRLDENVSSSTASTSASTNQNGHKKKAEERERRRWSDQNKKQPKSGLDKSELHVLATTSKINARTFVPFIEERDVHEHFRLPMPFSDRDGLLALSAKQAKSLKAWMRPEEFIEEPTVIERIDSGTIKQTVVTDCSFVASLAIAARYERRFGLKLISHIIYPQNKHGEPVVSPSGKYMCRLHVNGTKYGVLIDDLLPVGQHNQLLCSYSQNRNELWVSLLEKAYMKVMGGYDFPGSNSNIDLHALTGWIPERIPIRVAKEGGDKSSFCAEKVFDRLFTHFHRGNCLITLATGQMDQAEQERTGLIDSHAYAVLDLRKIDGKCLLLVKNPWTHLRWKGRFSERDTQSWTPELCAKLDYDPKSAQQFDDGLFWIDLPSVCAFFDIFYVNWKPTQFPFSYALHASWNAGKGPIRDLYSVGENPQYFLELNNRSGGAASVWILLSRHITEKEDFANNREYITVMVYKNGGKRVYLPYDPKPLTEGTRINSPHYLCQLLIKEPGIQRFSLVIAQYEKMKTIHYSLRVYSSVEFKCGTLTVPYKHSKKEVGEWRGETAAGCQANRLNNPLFHVQLEDEASDANALLVELRGPKEFSVGLEFALISSVRPQPSPFEPRDSGPFRPGFTLLHVDGCPAGTFAIRPMTFVPAQQGPFILRLQSSCKFHVKRVQ